MYKPVCDYLRSWSRPLNGLELVIYPCKSCFDLTKGTRPCDTPV
ncbi:hypothetical protein F383_21424 [Gossypium arboreum]|uniref:Uncharacterized protein n=1 Tax=Gossypium arboreum TaxID=29729 RepID=A0A0B0NUB7_GOSAR|nr:hypothetical protein F383_21424 [Gossypium arboreum]